MNQFGQLGTDLQRLGEGHVQREGDGLGHLIYGSVAHAHDPAHVPDDGLGLHGAEGDDLADVVAAVLPGHIVDDLLTALVAEVDVQIGHTDPLRVQKTLEQQTVFQGIQHGDAQGVGHDAACAAATARPHHDAVTLGIVDEVPHDEKVVHIAHVGDDGKLVFQPLAGLGIRVGILVRVQGFQPLAAQTAEHFFCGFAGVDGVMGQVQVAEIEGHMAALGDPLTVLDGLGEVGEHGPHFRFALDVELLGVHAHPGFILQGLAGLDAQKHLLRL